MARNHLPQALCHLQQILRPAADDPTHDQLLTRFLASADQAAFALLVRRHGPMVFGVCRRLLRRTQDAEDAFQATFLILVRKAANIGKRELLGNWLYGVALRVAVRVRLTTARHHSREIPDMARIAEATREPTEATDLSVAITEEVQRLPAKYRGPVVLYYLEGRTNEEVAGELHCPVGTIKTRLSRAREMLRKRLTRCGLTLSTAALSTALLAEASAAALPPVLIGSTLKAAFCFAAGDAAAGGLVSAQVAALTKGVLHTMLVTKMKTVVVVALALAVVLGGAGVFAYHVLATEANNKDKENIQGTWMAISAEAEGKARPEREIKDFTVVISADKVRFSEDRSATYKLDPTRTPKVIELTPLEGPARGKPQRAIYELNGYRLKMCVQNGKGDPPTEFKTKPGTDLRLLVLKRVKK